jgi:hypothetical protein
MSEKCAHTSDIRVDGSRLYPRPGISKLALLERRALNLPPRYDEGVIVCVTEQVLGRKPVLDRVRRKARFMLCQMLLHPSEEGRNCLPHDQWCAVRLKYPLIVPRLGTRLDVAGVRGRRSRTPEPPIHSTLASLDLPGGARRESDCLKSSAANIPAALVGDAAPHGNRGRARSTREPRSPSFVR